MKSLNVKIPMSIAQDMEDRGKLNPTFLSSFITVALPRVEILDRPIQEMSMNYTFKVADSLHKKLKLEAIERNLPMNELIGRLLQDYYTKL